MINHSTCDHPATSSARAKCRRGTSGSTPKKQATPKVIGGDEDDNYGQTPGRKEDECHVCHVERLCYKGVDRWSGMTVLVGQKCKWRIDPDTLTAYLT
jgi:hypothetical protein